MFFLGWGLNGAVFVGCLLLVVYDDQVATLLERLAPWLDLRVAGIIAICVSIVSVLSRLYMMLNPPDTIVIYWNLLYYGCAILTAVLLVSIVPDISSTFQLYSGEISGDGEWRLAGSKYDPSIATISLLAFMAFCVYRIEVVRNG